MIEVSDVNAGVDSQGTRTELPAEDSILSRPELICTVNWVDHGALTYCDNVWLRILQLSRCCE